MNSVQLRRRRWGSGKFSVEAIQELDVFAKVPETYVKSSALGGTLSIIALITICCLVWSEIQSYLHAGVKMHFTPDTELHAKVLLTVDLTVAMPCRLIGADVLDSTDQDMEYFGQLQEEDTWFELSPEQQTHFDIGRILHARLREEAHAIQDLLWKTLEERILGDMPPRRTRPNTPPDACRIHGSLELNKVAGNFHITAGKSFRLPVPIARGHAHLSPYLPDEAFNFSHRIERLSFGPPAPGLLQPLEGDEQIAESGGMLFQYWLQVVPTDVSTTIWRLNGFQYSVRNQSRPVSHSKGSHGVPGIYFKYDMAPLRVKVNSSAPTLWRFLLRLCAIVGGVYATAGMINGLVSSVYEFICYPSAQKKHSPMKEASDEAKAAQPGEVLVTPASSNVLTTELPLPPMVNLVSPQ